MLPRVVGASPDSEFLTRDVFAFIGRQKDDSFCDLSRILTAASICSVQQRSGLFRAGHR